MNVSTSQPVVLSHFSTEHLLGNLIATVNQFGGAFACYNLPHSKELQCIIDLSDEVSTKIPSLESRKAGFMVKPFVTSTSNTDQFLNADLIFRFDLKRFEPLIQEGEKSEKFRALFYEKLKEKNVSQALLPKAEDLHASKNNDFKKSVALATQSIQRGEFKKVVLVRKKNLPYTKPIDLAPLYLNVVQQYPTAFVSLLYTKQTGYWLTASPELLVGIDENKIFRTIALAGTQALSVTEDLSKAVWTQKEIEEQALVSRYIINCFKQIRLREFDEDGPNTVQSGKLMHLRTDFSVDLKSVEFPDLGTVMLNLLHPTSAVCGMPKEEALQFITKEEGINRQLFSGYLGPISTNGTAQIFVNLRCAKLEDGGAILFAGAGITKDSDPEKEFQETEIKMETIGQFL